MTDPSVDEVLRIFVEIKLRGLPTQYEGVETLVSDEVAAQLTLAVIEHKRFCWDQA